MLVCGSVGSGKSTVSEALADALDGVVIASDRVRKQQLGVPAETRLAADWGLGAYDPAHTRRTYAGLAERAQPVLASGRATLLDATFARRAQRALAAALAAKLGTRAFLVEVCCDRRVARARLARRAQEGRDASDAGPEILDASIAGFEATGDWPSAWRARIDSDRPDWRAAIPLLASRIRSAGD